jgi:hypothetical protein
MFAWLTRTRGTRASGSHPPRRPLAPSARLCVEQLESRYCPSIAPTVTLNVQEMPGHMVHLTGHVTDDSPSTVAVSFGGMVSGVTTPNLNGDYCLRTPASGLGTITAVGTDNQGLVSNTAAVNFSSAVPSLTLSYTWLSNRVVHLMGHVTDEFPMNRTVTFSGAVTGSALTDSSGNFSTWLTASALGPVTATVTDQWGQTSLAASVTLTNTAPVIQDFVATLQSGTIWVLTGRVIDEAASGLQVTFSGLPDLEGKSATVAADGTFSLTVDLEGECGVAQCTVTDWWNAISDVASARI